MKRQDKNEIKATVRRYYGSIAARNSAGCGCKPSSCCEGVSVTSHHDKEAEKLGYTQQDVQNVPAGTNLGLGCGNPTALASLKLGETVLDLGSGAGFDCLLAAQRVGEKGFIIGVDFASQMIEKARVNAAHGGYTNVEFRLGEIEHLPVADRSIDVILSNCVINLSPEKQKVFREIYRALKPGGRIAISDIALKKQLPDKIRKSIYAYVGCVSGAVLIDEYIKALELSGLKHIKITAKQASGCIDPDTNDPMGRAILDSLGNNNSLEEYIVSVYVEGRK